MKSLRLEIASHKITGQPQAKWSLKFAAAKRGSIDSVLPRREGEYLIYFQPVFPIAEQVVVNLASDNI
jgi:hypothetical protein